MQTLQCLQVLKCNKCINRAVLEREMPLPDFSPCSSLLRTRTWIRPSASNVRLAASLSQGLPLPSRAGKFPRNAPQVIDVDTFCIYIVTDKGNLNNALIFFFMDCFTHFEF